MLDFMDYVQNAFYEASHWNRNNSYGTLTATSQCKALPILPSTSSANTNIPLALLDFPTPLGLRLHISSLSTPHFASSYTLASTGLLSGSLSYLYTSLPLPLLPTSTTSLPLPHFTPSSYRQLLPLRPPDPPWWWEIWHAGRRIDTRDALLYGRLYLPKSTLEALYLRRLSPTAQVKISAVSDSRLPNGGSMLALLAQDRGKWSAEYMYSTDSALLGVRGLWNFGRDPREGGSGVVSLAVEELSASSSSSSFISSENTRVAAAPTESEPVSRLSAGAEAYYGLLNKSGGMSIGARFATLPAHTGVPYTMTATLNPLMGNLSASHSVRAGELLSLSSRFDFNFYSYESEVVMGIELWKLKENDGIGSKKTVEVVEDEKMLRTRKDGMDQKVDGIGDVAGCLKARIDQRGSVGLLWEGRVKELVYSCGASIDLRGGKDMISGVGLEVQYST
ncbi:MAG: hypothetical protein Q9169_001012 [Polycauliona sp. 2 TL-2023]